MAEIMNEPLSEGHSEFDDIKTGLEQNSKEDDDLPEKYRGKSVKEIVRMHQEAERLTGRQGQELGEIRKLADDLIQRQLASGATKQPEKVVEPVLEDTDFFIDPKKAINKAIESHPAVKEAREAVQRTAKDTTLAKLERAHPDVAQIGNDPEFVEWVKSSPVRLRLHHDANVNFDFDSANELLTNFKAQKATRTVITETAVEETKKQASKDLKAVASTQGATGDSSGKKVYRREDIRNLMLRDPSRYEALQPEIMAAYAEGRVK